mmetsp:Transcript_37942/g.73482  ORF Transcript_37942/g.73482 Transcript_37942/m.73482 type:complete len:270 (+) Transcript_37942:95-904(+)
MEQRRADIPDIFVRHPHEICKLYGYMIVFGMWPTLMLVLHNAYLMAAMLSCFSRHCLPRERFWFFWCLIRLVMVIPRPFWWLRAKNAYQSALRAPSPEEITRRLVQTQRTWWVRMNHKFGTMFTMWLMLTLMLCYLDVFSCSFSKALWNHCLMNLVNQLLQRLVSVVLLLYFTNSNMNRGLSEHLLNMHSDVVVYEESKAKDSLGERAMECSICFVKYHDGDQIRRIRCSHHYHKDCIDPWLVKYRNRCPLCNYVLGAEDPPASASPGT